MRGVAGGWSSTVCVVCLLSTEANAHSFETPYSLPIPFWMYAYGCAATLVLTFCLLGLATSRCTQTASPGKPKIVGHIRRGNLAALRAVASVCLVITAVAGLVGGQDPVQNIAMTLFWIVFMLGLAFASLLVGNIYTLINPWRVAISGVESFGIAFSAGKLPQFRIVGRWMPFVLYVGLIWVELFVAPTPYTVAIALLTYTAIVLLGATFVGKEEWFGNFDLFEAFFGVIGKLAPIQYGRGSNRDDSVILLRKPLTGALSDHAAHVGMVLFILSMLASTTYDGIHGTVWWMSLFWTNMLSIIQSAGVTDMGRAEGLLMGWYVAYQRAGLVIFPFLYFTIYVATLQTAKALTKTAIPLSTLILRFGHSMIPIAVAYSFTHYFTMFVTQIQNIPCVLSDPFDSGRRLFIAPGCDSPPVLQMALIWHLQVAALLIGHAAGVYLAHREATQIFATRRQSMRSQIPMLLLMVLYTVFGLWILSLPLGAGPAG